MHRHLIAYVHFEKRYIVLQLRQNDTCGVRTHALSEWRLEPPP